MSEAGKRPGRPQGTSLRQKPALVGVSSPPMVPPQNGGTGRNMLRPYGLARTYPQSGGGRGAVGR